MNPTIGIDLGTTYSLAAYVHPDGVPRLISNPEDKQTQVLLPSVVSLKEDGTLAAGWEARRMRAERPSFSISSVKRFMGKKSQMECGGRFWTPEEISALLLKEIKSLAEKFFSARLNHAVISVPAYFQENQREATRKAARLAGFEKPELLEEPAAALLAYRHPSVGGSMLGHGKIAVYDFGGGTFDISIFDAGARDFKILATSGDTSLGGEDIDERIARKLLGEIAETHGEAAGRDPRFVRLVQDEAERAKRAISHRGSCDIRIEDKEKGVKFLRALSRFELIDLSRDLVDRTVPLCEEALKKAGLAGRDIREVVLVGGTTRMPFVQETVEKVFGRKPHSEINPDHVVALGAAIQGQMSFPRKRES